MNFSRFDPYAALANSEVAPAKPAKAAKVETSPSTRSSPTPHVGAVDLSVEAWQKGNAAAAGISAVPVVCVRTLLDRCIRQSGMWRMRCDALHPGVDFLSLSQLRRGKGQTRSLEVS